MIRTVIILSLIQAFDIAHAAPNYTGQAVQCYGAQVSISCTTGAVLRDPGANQDTRTVSPDKLTAMLIDRPTALLLNAMIMSGQSSESVYFNNFGVFGAGKVFYVNVVMSFEDKVAYATTMDLGHWFEARLYRTASPAGDVYVAVCSGHLFRLHPIVSDVPPGDAQFAGAIGIRLPIQVAK